MIGLKLEYPMAEGKTYNRIKYDTSAFEEAISASIRAASLPAKQALANARYTNAKALLLKVCAYFLLVLCIIIIAWTLFTTFQNFTRKSSTVSELNDPVAPQEQNTPIPIVQSKKETIIRNKINEALTAEVQPDAKTLRSQLTLNRSSDSMVDTNSPIGRLISQNTADVAATSSADIDPTRTENMVVGPEVQTLTVFNAKEVTLSNGTLVEVVAGHRYANNSSTKDWREGYCYVTVSNGLSVRIDLATKPGKGASVVDRFIGQKELDLLGGSQEVENLRALCPWLNT